MRLFNLLDPKLGWHWLYIIPLVAVCACGMAVKKTAINLWKLVKQNRSQEHNRLRIIAGISKQPKSSDTVRYNITNSGSLEIDAEALVNSDGWKRQVAAAKRLKDIQDDNDSIVIYNITDPRCKKR